MRGRHHPSPEGGDMMPIPPIAEYTEYVVAGPLTIGIEYRNLDADVMAENYAFARKEKYAELQDAGVSIHVCETPAEPGAEPVEYLRFDCFMEDPHYHYVTARERSNEIWDLDPITHGDPVAFALRQIEENLSAMLARAGAPELAERIDRSKLAEVLPDIAAKAEAARTRGLPARK